MSSNAFANTSGQEVTILNAQAQELFAKNQCVEAMELCKQSINLTDNYDANILYARILTKLSRRKEALAHLITMQKKGFKHHLIDELIANIYLFYGDYDQAYTHLINAIKQNSKLISARAQLARIYYNRQEYEKAEENIEFTANRGIKTAEIWGRYGRILTERNKISEAYNAFLKEEELSKSFISALNLANIELIRENIDSYIKYKDLSISRSVNAKFIKRENSNTLTVLLSPHSKNFILQKYNFEEDTLFLNDGSDTYYTSSADYISNIISDLHKINSYKKVILIGTSKGATGALIISTLLAKSLPETPIKALAFSPQIFLWPFNKNLLMPSYLQLYERIAGNKLLEDNFIRYGNIDKLLDGAPSNLDATMIYGTGFDMDRIEGENTTTKKIKKIPLKYSSHGTLMVYTLPLNATKQDLLNKHNALQGGDDDSAALSAQNTQWIDELFEIHAKESQSLEKLCNS